MSILKLYDSGFTDVVSVIPPNGKLSPKSAIAADQRGKCPGLLVDGTWRGYPFTTTRFSRDVARRVGRTGANVGLLGNRFPALDIDVDDDAQLSAAIRGLAELRLGMAPVRTSRGTRQLLVYRSDAPFGRMAAVVERNGKSHLVEFLAEGRQYLVHGRHPAGMDYGWEGPPLWSFTPEDLPLVSRGSVRDFFDELKAQLEAKGLKVELVGDGRGKAESEVDQADLLAPSWGKLVELVSELPNTAEMDRAHYVQVACAVKAACGGKLEGRQLFGSWADRWAGGDANPEHDDKTWDSLEPPFRVGWTWLQEQAERGGSYASAQDEFQVDASAPAPETEKPKSPRADTDEAVLDALLPVLSEKLRYVPRSREWYVWGGHRWLRDMMMDHELLVRGELAKLTEQWRDQAKASSKKRATELKKLVSRYQSATGIANIVSLTRAKISCRPDDFDRDPWSLNTPGGVVDLETGAISASVPGEMFARCTGVPAVLGPSPLWDRFLRDLTGGDPQLTRYLQKLCGYALTGDVSEKLLAFIWGSDSDTGKSTFIRVLMRVMGDYADTVDVQAFIGSNRDRIPAELARLPGVRLVTATEPAAGHSWDEKRIKAITGGDEIEVRFLHGQPFTYQPQFKIVIIGNHEPEIRTVDDAMLRRIHIVPFNRKVARDRQVENLSQLLVEREGPQILAWALDGCVAWAKEGLNPPDVVLKKTREYERDEDTLQQWIDSECELEKSAVTPRETLYRAWVVWCHERGEEPGKFKQFKRRLASKRALGLSEDQTSTGGRRLRATRGIRLRAHVETGAQEEFNAAG